MQSRNERFGAIGGGFPLINEPEGAARQPGGRFGHKERMR